MTTTFLNQKRKPQHQYVKQSCLKRGAKGKEKKEQSWEMEEPYLLGFYSQYANSINIEILSFFGKLLASLALCMVQAQ